MPINAPAAVTVLKALSAHLLDELDQRGNREPDLARVRQLAFALDEAIAELEDD